MIKICDTFYFARNRMEMVRGSCARINRLKSVITYN